MAGQQAPLHIVMVPFPAQGHLTPFLALAELIAQRNPRCTITLVTTPLNVSHLEPSLPTPPSSSSAAALRLHALPFRAADHGLPPHSENTDSLPISSIIALALASEALEPHFDRLVSDLAPRGGPLCVVGDFFCGWTGRVARRHGASHATFTTCGGYGTAAFASLWLHLPHLADQSQEFRVPGLPEGFTLHRSQMSPFMRGAGEPGSDPAGLGFFRRHVALAFESGAVLCNTVEELEPAGVRSLRELLGRKLYTVGPLLPLDRRASYRRSGRPPGIGPEACAGWLDAQPPGSVVYVSFGSQNSIAAPQMMGLAEGLEASGRPFVWVVRPPVGFDLSGSFREEWLPEGFEARMGGGGGSGGRGLLVRNWAPQLEILSHRSTGVFLSHCGWNSVLESLSRGVPMIGWPLAAEQFYNVKMLEEELGVAVELARGTESEVRSSDVAGAIELALSDGKGRLMKERAVAAASTIADAMKEGDGRGSSVKAIDEFLESVRRDC